jgi:hypothetical protein
MAGNRLAQQMFWVPQSGDIGVGVSILSYNNQVQFGLVTDKKFVPEPARIVDRFSPEFEKLVFYLLLNGNAPQVAVPQSIEEVIPSPARKRTVSTKGRTSRPRATNARATAGERARAPVVPPPGIRKGGMLKRLREQE